MNAHGVARLLSASVKLQATCATCGKVPDIAVAPRAWDDTWEVSYLCHGRIEVIPVLGEEMLAGKLPWYRLARPFWPGFSRYRAKARPDVGRRQVWRERKASAQRVRREQQIRRLASMWWFEGTQ